MFPCYPILREPLRPLRLSVIFFPRRHHDLVANKVVVELKSVEAIAQIHESMMLTYLRLSDTSLGLLINFNVPVLKHGIRKIRLALQRQRQR
jgi:hypothetical protein